MSKKSMSNHSVKLKNALSVIKKALHRYLQFVKGLSSIPHAKRYFAAVPFLILFFIITTFPLDIFIQRELLKQEGSLYKNIKFDDLSITPFHDWTADAVSIFTMQKSSIDIYDIDADLGTVSLLSRRLNGSIDIGKLSYSSEDFKFDCTISSNSDISFDSNDLPSAGSITIRISDISIKGLTILNFKIPAMKIPKADISASFSSRNMLIRECSINSRDFSGTLKGTINLDKIISRSTLNLTFEIDSNSEILKDYRPLLGTYINPSTGKLSMTIQGNIGSPSTDFVSQNQPINAPSIKR